MTTARRSQPAIAGEPLFRFAVIADTHLNPEDDRSSSPWRTNALANARARAVIAQLNALRPAFVIHLGDIVHPVPAHPAYRAAASRFRALFAALDAPLHLVAGNHDVGDKPTPWMPAAAIDARSLALYREYFGTDTFAFEHGGCRFVVMNSQLLNSGLPDEAQQWTWLAEQLGGGHRVFLFKHYPPFLHEPGEDEHYDNLAEPARSRLLTLLAERPIEALFCGHVHNFFYNRVAGADCYVLPATSAVRHDYMELFPIPPPSDAEHGRDARSKLGFFQVDVHRDGHVAHWIRSWGETDPARAVAALRTPTVHARGPIAATVGVDLRHGWADTVSIPFTGVVDEFGRKRVRNDYVTAALWELGLRRLRIPLQDLSIPETARRVADLGAAGHRFTVFAFGLPTTEQRERLRGHLGWIEAIEIIGRGADLADVIHRSGDLRVALGLSVFVSKLRVSAETERDSARYAHFIRHGFLAAEHAAIAEAARLDRSAIDGLVFRVEHDEPPWPTLAAIADAASAMEMRAQVHVRLAANDPAQDVTDDAATARRVADAALAAWAHQARLSVFLDTFADHDRGYHPRHGLVDRACDPRPAGRVVARLAERLHGIDPRTARASAAGPARLVEAADRRLVMLLPEPAGEGRLSLPRAFIAGFERIADAVRLDSGAPIALRLRPAADGVAVDGCEGADGMPILVRL